MDANDELSMLFTFLLFICFYYCRLDSTILGTFVFLMSSEY